MSGRRRISKVSLLALVVTTTLAATGLATVMTGVTTPVRDPNDAAAVDVMSVDADADRLVLAHRSGESLRATDHVVTVTVDGETLRWDGATARGHRLTADSRAVFDLSTGRVWWGVAPDAAPTWREAAEGRAIDVRPGDTVRVQVFTRDSDLSVVDLRATV